MLQQNRPIDGVNQLGIKSHAPCPRHQIYNHLTVDNQVDLIVADLRVPPYSTARCQQTIRHGYSPLMAAACDPWLYNTQCLTKDTLPNLT